MRTILLTTAAVLLTGALAGCQRERPADEAATRASPVETSPPDSRPAPLPSTPTRRAMPRAVAPVMTGPTPPMAEGAIVQYDCNDGSALTITFARGAAKVTLDDGRRLALARAGEAPEGGELYESGALSLRRAGNGIDFTQDETGPRRCIEGVSTA